MTLNSLGGLAANGTHAVLSYTSAGSTLAGSFTFDGTNTSQTIGGEQFALSTTTNPGQLDVIVTRRRIRHPHYALAVAAASTRIMAGQSTHVTMTASNLLTAGTNADGINYTGLGALANGGTGGIGQPVSSGSLAVGNSVQMGETLTAATSGAIS